MSGDSGRAGIEGAELGLQDYGRMVWRRKLIVVVAGAVALLVSVGLDSRKVPIYTGSASVLLTPTLSQVVGVAGNAGSLDVPTAVKVIQGHTVQQAAADLLHLKAIPGASAAQQGSTNVATITVSSTDPVLAARAANAYADAYISTQHTQVVNSLLDASTQVSARISALDTQIAAIQKQISEITSQEVPVTAANGSSNGLPQATPTQTAQISALNLQATALNEQASAFKQELGQILIESNLARGGGQVLSQAGVNRTPISPRPTRDATLALAFGLVLGVGLALLRDLQDDRIRSEDDLTRSVGGLPALGQIPTLENWKERSSIHLVSVEAPTSPAAEAYRELRTAIQFMSLDKPIRSLLVASPVAGDGKTTTVANLALNMAQAGQRVVMIGADLRRPRLHEFFGLSNEVGLTSVLLGTSTLAEALQMVPGQENLLFLAAGPIPPNPSELLSSAGTMRVMKELGEIADVVVLDSPPVLPVTDASVMAARADAVVLVASANKTHRRAAAQSLELLNRVGAHVVGVVINNVPRGDTSYSYRTAYQYKYGRYEPSHLAVATPSKNGTKHAPSPEAASPNGTAASTKVPAADIPVKDGGESS